MSGIKMEEDSSQDNFSNHGAGSSAKRVKVMSPGSVTLPTMPNWDLGQSLSPFCPPDMNSNRDPSIDFPMKLNSGQRSTNCHLSVNAGIASGSMMTGMTAGSGSGSSSSSSATNVGVVNNPLGSPFDNILGNDWSNAAPSSAGIHSGIPQHSQQDPLANLMDSVNSLDPLNSLGKSLNEQVTPPTQAPPPASPLPRWTLPQNNPRNPTGFKY